MQDKQEQDQLEQDVEECERLRTSAYRLLLEWAVTLLDDIADPKFNANVDRLAKYSEMLSKIGYPSRRLRTENTLIDHHSPRQAQPKEKDQREKIQDMLLERIERLFEKYDMEAQRNDDAVGNAGALQSIAVALQAVGYPARNLTVGSYAASAQTPQQPQEPPA